MFFYIIFILVLIIFTKIILKTLDNYKNFSLKESKCTKNPYKCIDRSCNQQYKPNCSNNKLEYYNYCCSMCPNNSKIKKNKKIKQISIKTGSTITMIKFLFDDGTSISYGTSAGNKSYVLNLDFDEYVKELYWKNGNNRGSACKIVTSKNKILSFGVTEDWDLEFKFDNIKNTIVKLVWSTENDFGINAELIDIIKGRGDGLLECNHDNGQLKYNMFPPNMQLLH